MESLIREAAIRRLARLYYLSYCDRKGTFPYKGTYIPQWAEDYALISVSILGLDGAAMDRLLSGDEAVPA